MTAGGAYTLKAATISALPFKIPEEYMAIEEKVDAILMVKNKDKQADTTALENHPLQPVADILVLAGDTGYLGDEGFVKHPFWDWASENFKEVIVIPGNHEFYLGYDLGQLHDGWCMEIRHNIRCYYNAVIHLSDDTDLIVSTLWGYIEPQDAFSTERRVNDFYRIKDCGVVINSERFNQEHAKCRAFIEKRLCSQPQNTWSRLLNIRLSS